MHIPNHRRWILLLSVIVAPIGFFGLLLLTLNPVNAAPSTPLGATSAGIKKSLLLPEVPGFPVDNYIISTDDNKNIFSYAIYGDGTFGEEELIYSESGTSTKSFIGFAIGDYDRDGDNDFIATRCSGSYTWNSILCVTGNDDGALWFFEQTTSGTFVTSTVLASTNLRTGGFVAADFNGDGYLDLAGRVGNSVGQVFLNQRDGTFEAGSTFSYAHILVTSQPVPQYSAGDVDNDGDVDLVLANYQTSGDGWVILFHNDGTGNLTYKNAYNPAATIIYVGGTAILGYFDGDSDLDIGGCLTNVSYVAMGVNQTELLSQLSSLQIAI